ncbi:MAG: hypothetical protein ABSC94_02480 [Polyangiaceae bacterium]
MDPIRGYFDFKGEAGAIGLADVTGWDAELPPRLASTVADATGPGLLASAAAGATTCPATPEAMSVSAPTSTTHAPTIAPIVTSVRLSSVWLSIGASGMLSLHLML